MLSSHDCRTEHMAQNQKNFEISKSAPRFLMKVAPEGLLDQGIFPMCAFFSHTDIDLPGYIKILASKERGSWRARQELTLMRWEVNTMLDR
jgi:hypothetical protein